MDLSTIKDFIDKHRHATIIICVVLVVFIIFSVVRFSQVQTERDQEAQSEQTELESVKNDAINKLTSEQRNKQNNYSKEIQDVIDILDSHLWATNDKKNLVAFEQTTFTQRTEDGKSTTTPFVVDVVEPTQSKTTDADITVYIIAVETDSDSFMMKLTKESSDGKSYDYFLESSGLKAPREVYSVAASNSNVTITPLSQDALQLIGNDQDSLNKALQDYVAQYLPATSKIEWTKSVIISWENNTISIPYTLDSTRYQIQVVYNRSDKTFIVQSIK